MNKIKDIKQNIKYWNFGTEFKSLHVEKDELEKELEQVSKVMEMQTHLQKQINQGLSMKHPDTFQLEDRGKRQNLTETRQLLKCLS